MSFANYNTPITDDVQLPMFETLANSMKNCPMHSLHEDMKTFVESLDGGHDLYAVWKEFTRKIISELPVYIFFHLLKSLELLPKKSRTDITKELCLTVKYRIAYSYKEKRRVYELYSMDMFHPMYLDLSFKVLTDYLACNKQLPTLNDIPRAMVYYRLMDEFTNTSCSIFVPMYVYNSAYTKYMDTTHFDARFTPPLSFQELKTYLVRHSNQDLYASRYNRKMEQVMCDSIRCSRPELTPFDEHDLLDAYQSKMGVQFNPQQLQTIVSTISSPITLIQGSAGTGKSTIVTAITDILLKRGESVLFLTISTKARDVLRSKLEHYKTIYDVTGIVQADTIAKFLCRPCKWCTIVVDEASMIGNSQCIRFLASFHKRLILIGDGKQVLPVCQIGTPFLCLQESAGKYINICTLTLIQRQTQDNPILHMVQTLMDKKTMVVPEYTGQTTGVFYKRIDSEQHFARFYRTFYGKHMCCIKPAYYLATSKIIHAELNQNNTPLVERYEKRYVGDFLMRTKTDTFVVIRKDRKISFEIPNGSYCKIVGMRGKHVEVEYMEHDQFHECVTPGCLFSDFQLAYCQSTHKFQGSEYDTVLLNMNNNPYILKEGGKNIFYTSITRAKKLLILCGTNQDKSILSKISANDFAMPVHDLFVPFDMDVSNTSMTCEACYDFVPLCNETMVCTCGAILKSKSLKAHLKTKKHQSLCAK